MYVCVYIYIYINLNTTIEIVKASKHLLNATEWTNCFHIVVKSLTRIQGGRSPGEQRGPAHPLPSPQLFDY